MTPLRQYTVSESSEHPVDPGTKSLPAEPVTVAENVEAESSTGTSIVVKM